MGRYGWKIIILLYRATCPFSSSQVRSYNGLSGLAGSQCTISRIGSEAKRIRAYTIRLALSGLSVRFARSRRVRSAYGTTASLRFSRPSCSSLQYRIRYSLRPIFSVRTYVSIGASCLSRPLYLATPFLAPGGIAAGTGGVRCRPA